MSCSGNKIEVEIEITGRGRSRTSTSPKVVDTGKTTLAGNTRMLVLVEEMTSWIAVLQGRRLTIIMA